MRDSIDAQAEREAAAEEFFEEHLGQPVPTTRLKKARDEALCAAARCLPKPAVYHYCKLAAIEEWERVCRIFAGGGVVVTVREFRFDSREDRNAREFRRMASGALVPPGWAERSGELAARLQKLAVYHGAELVTAPLAAALASIPERTFFRLVERGKIPAVKLRGGGASRYIRVGELRNFLSGVVSVAS